MEVYFTKNFRKKYKRYLEFLNTHNQWQRNVSFAKFKFYLGICVSGLPDTGLFGLLVCLLNLLNIFVTLWNSLFAAATQNADGRHKEIFY